MVATCQGLWKILRMEIKPTKFQDCVMIKPDIFSDSRGFFLETFQKKRYEELASINLDFVQDNRSSSERNILRGLHLQKERPQGKLVYVTFGEVFDVVVDLRPGSPTFAQWGGFSLSSENNFQLWVPPGFAHGFVVISERAEFHYKCTDYYDPNDEICLMWDDEDIGISWPILEEPTLSEKDRAGSRFKDLLDESIITR